MASPGEQGDFDGLCNENLAARIIAYSCGIVIVRTKGNSVDCLVSFQLQFDMAVVKAAYLVLEPSIRESPSVRAATLMLCAIQSLSKEI
jgi:hypothetical protein